MYVPPGKKLTNLDSVKKAVEKNHLTIIVSGDDKSLEKKSAASQIKSLVPVTQPKILIKKDIKTNQFQFLMLQIVVVDYKCSSLLNRVIETVLYFYSLQFLMHDLFFVCLYFAGILSL